MEKPVTQSEKLIHLIKLAGTRDATRAPEVASYLQDKDPEVVGSAIFKLGELGARHYIPDIARFLSEARPEILTLACAGLKLMVDGRDAALLEALRPLMHHPDVRVRGNAVEAIGKIGSESSVDELMGVFPGSNPFIKVAIVGALADIRSKTALPLLEGYRKELEAMDLAAPRRPGTIPPAVMIDNVDRAIKAITAKRREAKPRVKKFRSGPSLTIERNAKAAVDYGALALSFAEHLVKRKFAAAHAMLASALREECSPADLEKRYDRMLEYVSDAPERLEVMEASDDPAFLKEKGDVGWAYVAIGGPDYSEAVTVTVSRESGTLSIASLEWGRP